jgi:two-component system chemotaxis sensor kinase CheA
VATGLAYLAAGQAGGDTIHAVFRAVHSIKGAAGAFGMDALVAFAHRFETALDAAREGRLELDATALAAFSRGGDVLAALVEAARADGDADAEEVTGALAEIDALIGADAEEEAGAATSNGCRWPSTPWGWTRHRRRAGRSTSRPTAPFYDNGHDPLAYLQALAELGTPDVECDLSRLPPLAALDPEEAHLSWRITLETERTLLEIEEVSPSPRGCASSASDPPTGGPAPHEALGALPRSRRRTLPEAPREAPVPSAPAGGAEASKGRWGRASKGDPRATGGRLRARPSASISTASTAS